MAEWDIGSRKQDHPYQMSLLGRTRASAGKILHRKNNKWEFFAYDRYTAPHTRIGQLIVCVDNETITLVSCDQRGRVLVINENSTIDDYLTSYSRKASYLSLSFMAIWSDNTVDNIEIEGASRSEGTGKTSEKHSKR